MQLPRRICIDNSLSAFMIHTWVERSLGCISQIFTRVTPEPVGIRIVSSQGFAMI